MDELMEIVGEATEMLEKEVGTPALEEGDEAVFLLNNCVLVLGLENGTIKVHFIGGKPYVMDRTCGVYSE